MSGAGENGGPCLFCQIVRGELTAAIVFEDAASLAFLDHRPVFPGHCLLIPREHHETLGDLPDRLLAPLLGNAKLLALAVERGLDAEGSFVAINNRVSQSVSHLHVHIVPRRRRDGLRGFFWPRQRYESVDAMADMQGKLRRAIEELGGSAR